MIISSELKVKASSASAQSDFKNFKSSAMIASNSPTKNGASSQRLRKIHDSNRCSALLMIDVSARSRDARLYGIGALRGAVL
jgi:hypothetical protein